jgi:phosphoglycolate phosphatase-like HAD superfamily hydrolase
MSEQTYVFIDFDDTLSNAQALWDQYTEELASLLSVDVGGDKAAWKTALRPAIDRSLDRYAETFRNNPLAGYTQWIDAERVRFIEEVFAETGQPLPTCDPLVEFAKRMQFDALTACNAAFPGAEEALRELFEMGVRTQMASAQESEFLLAALIGAQVESYIESKFGPDLVCCAKEGPEFYRRIFEACHVHPSQAIVVDDQPLCLDWAEEAGAKVVQARIQPHAPEPQFPIVLHALSDLPGLVKELSSR